MRNLPWRLPPLLEQGHSTIAGRLAGAFRDIGRDQIADEIIKTMISAGYDIREANPFETPAVEVLGRDNSPSVYRMKLLWQTMRPLIINHFPLPDTKYISPENYLKQIEAAYITDAYHSLSIEGYRVSE